VARHSDDNERLERTDFVVEGLAAVAEYAKHRRSALRAVFAEPSALKEAQARLSPFGVSVLAAPSNGGDDAQRAARGSWSQRGAPKSKRADAGRSPDRSTSQSLLSSRKSPVWADVHLELQSESDLDARISSRANDLLLALDHVSDPRNLGAIVRSSAFFGVREVVVPERRQVLLTSASVNTAQGGFAITDLFTCVNLGRTLERLKADGYWIVGADMGGEPFASVAGFYAKTVLVLGAEDSGLSPGIRAKCDRIVSIQGIPGSLESLNVAVAAGILLAGFAASGKRS